MSPTNVSSVSRPVFAGALLGAALAVVGCGSGDDQVTVRVSPDKSAAPADHATAAPKPVIPEHGARTLKDTPFERSWDLQLPRPVRSSWINPHIPDLLLFTLTGEGNELYAVDAFSGNTRWVTPTFPKAIRLPPDVTHVKTPDGKGGNTAASDDRVWVVCDDTLYSIDAIYGQTIWRYALPFSPSTGPLALGSDVDQRVFLGDWDNRIQVVTFHPQKQFPYILWQINLHSPIVSKPVELENRVYGADQAGTVHCFEYDRAEVWNYATGSSIEDSPMVRGRVLFVGNDDNVLYAINRFTGERIGTLYVDGPIKRSPFCYSAEPTRVYVWMDDRKRGAKGLYAVKTLDDTIPFTDTNRRPLEVERMATEWFTPDVDRLVGSSPDYLFATSGKSTVVKAINRASGKVDWTWDINEDHYQNHNQNGSLDRRQATFITQYFDGTDRNRSIYSVDETGHVIAYRVYGDKPGDPLGGNRVRTASLNVPAVEADDQKAAPKAKADKPADAAAAPADAAAAPADKAPADKAPADKPADAAK